MLLHHLRAASVGAVDHARRIYYGAQYGGGSTTSVLVNIPGEATRS